MNYHKVSSWKYTLAKSMDELHSLIRYKIYKVEEEGDIRYFIDVRGQNTIAFSTRNGILCPGSLNETVKKDYVPVLDSTNNYKRLRVIDVYPREEYNQVFHKYAQENMSECSKYCSFYSYNRDGGASVYVLKTPAWEIPIDGLPNLTSFNTGYILPHYFYDEEMYPRDRYIITCGAETDSDFQDNTVEAVVEMARESGAITILHDHYVPELRRTFSTFRLIDVAKFQDHLQQLILINELLTLFHIDTDNRSRIDGLLLTDGSYELNPYLCDEEITGS